MSRKPTRRLSPIFVLVLAAIWLSACRTPTPSAPRPDLDPVLLVDQWTATYDARDGLLARARVSIKAPDMNLARPQRIAAARPDTLRLEILGLFNQVAAIFVVREGEYQLWEAGEREIETGEVTAFMLWRVARVALTPEEVVDLFLGAPRPAPGLAIGAARWGKSTFDVDRVDAAGQLVERVSFDTERRLRGFARFDAEGELVWSATFDDHRPLMGGDGVMQSFAYEVRLRFPAERARVKVDYRDVELDPELAPTLFELGKRGSTSAATR